MRVIIGIATMRGRELHLKRAMASLRGQADQIRVYNNAIMRPDYADNGKFYFLRQYADPVYYLSCDDDLIYPKGYVQSMVEAIEHHQSIVTHHGRILTDFGVSYYRGHQVVQCLKSSDYAGPIDVAGTGVTAFRTDYFNPVDIYHSKYKRMSDLIFSLEAARQDKKIIALPHAKGYIKQIPIEKTKTIAGTESRRERRQIEIADQILRIKIRKYASE